MKISLGLPTQRVDQLEEFVTGEAVAEMSRTAESAGFDAVFVTEHPFPEKSWMDTGGHHALDPFVALSFAAAATTRIRLQTHLCVLPYRNPFLTAKSVASLDRLSGGRVILGAGTGYLEAEFAALGVDFADRNELTDEAIVAMKAAWSGEPLSLSSRHFDANDNFALPRPLQEPHPPIWIGGNSKRAIRRAVELADGWAPMPNPAQTAARRHSAALETLDDLKARIDYAAGHAEAVGRRTPLTIASSLGGLAMDTLSTNGGSTNSGDTNSGDTNSGAANGGATNGGDTDVDDLLVETAEQLAGVGVTYLYGGVLRPVDSRAEFLGEVIRMGETLVPRLATIPTQTDS